MSWAHQSLDTFSHLLPSFLFNMKRNREGDCGSMSRGVELDWKSHFQSSPLNICPVFLLFFFFIWKIEEKGKIRLAQSVPGPTFSFSYLMCWAGNDFWASSPYLPFQPLGSLSLFLFNSEPKDWNADDEGVDNRQGSEELSFNVESCLCCHTSSSVHDLGTHTGIFSFWRAH